MEFNPGPEIIYEYFQDLTAVQKEQYLMLGEIYSYWNERINIISRKDFQIFYQNHVLHSMGIAMIQQFSGNDKVLDVGTGGGFPGIPLAIYFPETSFHLIDSIGKKIRVIREVINELGLKNTTCQQTRAEEIKGSYNFILSRAVTRLKKFVPWVRSSLAPGGQLLSLKGGNLEEEMSEIKANITTYPLGEYLKEPYFATKKVLRISGV